MSRCHRAGCRKSPGEVVSVATSFRLPCLRIFIPQHFAHAHSLLYLVPCGPVELDDVRAGRLVGLRFPGRPPELCDRFELTNAESSSLVPSL